MHHSCWLLWMTVCCAADAGQDRMTITCDKHTFNFQKKGGFTFLVAADEAYGRQIPFAFLDRVSEDFLNTQAAKSKAAAAPNSLDRVFGPKLKQHMVSKCWMASSRRQPARGM
jgi:hypothetical protein